MVVVRVDGVSPYVYFGCESIGVHGCISTRQMHSIVGRAYASCVVWQKRWCMFVCKWHNSKRVVLRRLRSNPQSLADPESSQSAPAVLSRLRSSPSSLAQPKSSQPASALGLCRRCVADFDTLAVALICYAAWGGLPSCPRTLLRSPAFPPIGHCVTCNGLGRTGIRKPTEVCGGFKHI